MADMVGQQFKQTDYVLDRLEGKRGGFYIDFGAWDGIHFSNTYVLERDYGWTGILAEGDPQAHERLKANRPNSIVDTRVVWGVTGETVEFNSVAGGKLSGVDEVMKFGHPKTYIRERIKHQLQTVSLNDLWDQNGAPEVVDFVSVDVEGSELTILQNFDFSYKHKVNIFCVEHWLDFTEIRQLMQDHGYIHHYNEASWWAEMNRCIESYFLHPDLVDFDFKNEIDETNAKYDALVPVDPKDILREKGLI